jgi:hypothetical protein
MSTKGEVLRQPDNGSEEETWDGFSWPAFFFGIIWLLAKGLYGQFLINLVIILGTAGVAAPIVWIVYGFIGNGAYKKSLLKKGYLTKDQWERRNSSFSSVQNPNTQSQRDSATQLRDLAELRAQGVLTEDEFLKQKAKLLTA